MKKLASLLLALVMIMSCFSAMAEEAKYTITINNAPSDSVFEAYQIFAGDLAKEATSDTEEGTNAVLSNITWGNGVNGTALLSDLQATETFKDCTDAVSVAQKLHNSKNDPNVVKEFASIVAKNLANVAGTSGEYNATDKSYTISGLEAGYYLVKDKAGTVTGNEAYTRFIIEVVENSTVATKSSVPTVDKQVKDKNDTEGSTSGWQDSADYDIGDAVPFKLTATLASNVTDYDTYKIVFHDTLSAGLTYNNDAVVKFGDTDVSSYFTITNNGTTLTISCADVTDFGATNSSVITVEYTATLNDKATIGATGNTNSVNLEYSNNPNEEQDGTPETGTTPNETVIVFTYELDVNKVDEKNDALKGAGFTLYKWVKTVAEDGTVAENWVAVGSELKGDELTTFVFKGLDEGKYKLSETTTPAGYNTVEDIIFVIESTITDNKLTSLVVKDEESNVLSGEGTGASFSAACTSGIVATSVVNKAGATLPETGGMGTTLLYVGGGILVLAAIVLLIAKRRTSAE